MSKRRILIYDSAIDGHHMEYLHHIFMATDGVDAKFVFAIPERFLALKDKMAWPERQNVQLDLIPESELTKTIGGYIKERWNKARLAAKYIRKHKVDEVFYVELVVQFPFLPLFAPKGVKVSGILYRLLPYEWKRLSLITKIKDTIEVNVIGRSKLVKTPMCLNDNSCACYFNKLFKTSKYIPIVDPIKPLNYQPKSIRKDLGAGTNDKVILHFGGMTIRKGTLTLLEGACRMSESQLKNKIFVFAGKVSKDIKSQFDSYIVRLQQKCRVVKYEGFCAYELLADLCFSCDCIVVPYKNTSYSSGVIGDAAQYQKTVVGPGDGLLGKLIRRNRLGVTMKENNPTTLAVILGSDEAYLPRPNNYSQKESVEEFSKTVIETLTR